MDSSADKDAKTSTQHPFQWITAVPALMIHTGLILVTLLSVCLLRITDNVSQAFTEQILTLIVSTVLGGGAVSVGTKLGGKPSGNESSSTSGSQSSTEASS